MAVRAQISVYGEHLFLKARLSHPHVLSLRWRPHYRAGKPPLDVAPVDAAGRRRTCSATRPSARCPLRSKTNEETAKRLHEKWSMWLQEYGGRDNPVGPTCMAISTPIFPRVQFIRKGNRTIGSTSMQHSPHARSTVSCMQPCYACAME